MKYTYDSKTAKLESIEKIANPRGLRWKTRTGKPPVDINFYDKT